MREDTTLDRMCSEALERDPAHQALEFAGEWVCWGEVRRVADQVGALIAQSGVPVHAAIAFVPRNRPAAVAAFLGMLAQARSVRMVYAFQSATGIARDLDRLEPAVVVAHAEDFSAEVLDVLRARGAAAIALEDMHAAAVEGL